MTDRDIMQQALEALELLVNLPTEEALDYADNAIDALRDRLAQPEQDAVLAEREACAKVCDSMPAQGLPANCAVAIRARGNT